jgi:hypothetical protein
MSAYKSDLHIRANESGRRAELAAGLVSEGQGVVVIEETLALRPNGGELLCEVISRPSLDVATYRAAVENAKALLASSSLAAATSSKKLSWLVVEDYGTGTLELWHAS